MRSGTSFFNGTVWKKTMLRFWPVWAVSLVAWGLALPMQGLMAMRKQLADGGDWFVSFAAGVGSLGEEFALLWSVGLGLLAAMAVCSHLYSSRSANFMGALPVRREGLFVSHYAAGLSMLLLPNIVVFLLTLLVELAGGVVMWPPLMFWLAALCGMEFFFYSFAVCIGMFTGHLLALPIFYGIFNGLAAAVRYLLNMTMIYFYYGYSASQVGAEVADWLTPVFKLTNAVGTRIQWGEGRTGVVAVYECWGLDVVGIYALVGLALTIASLLLYRRRNLETAGDVVAVRAMRPVFKYGVAICAGLFFGYLTSAVLGFEVIGLMVAIVLWGVAGYFVAQMLLDKSFRVFGKWKGALGVAAAFALLFLVVGFDLTGYETRVPLAEDVASVKVTGIDSYPDDGGYFSNAEIDDPTDIALLTALHQAVVDHREEYGEEFFQFNLTYTLKSGGTLSRSYSVQMDPAQAEEPGTVAWAMEQALASRTLVWKAYGFDAALDMHNEGGRLADVYYEDPTGRTYIPLEAGEVSERPDVSYQEPVAATESDDAVTDSYIYGGDALELWNAVTADFQAGKIGVRELTWRAEMEQWPILTFHWERDGSNGTEYARVRIAVPDTAERTLAVLAELTEAVEK